MIIRITKRWSVRRNESSIRELKLATQRFNYNY